MKTAINISSEIRIENYPPALERWCKENLKLANPDYNTRIRIGKTTFGIPEKISLYRKDGNALILPYGCLDPIYRLLESSENVSEDFKEHKINYNANISLYDYQEKAVSEMVKYRNGILNAPAGSGKTQCGLAMIFKLGLKALWLTHTTDLLKQSYDRAKQFTDEKLLGTITGGFVNIGSGITFATVQTMAKLDLQKYKHDFDIVICDECHRVCGTELKRTQFSTVLNNLSAKYKYGLTATVHRSDMMEKAMFSLLGNVRYVVPDEAVKNKIMQVKIERVNTGTAFPENCVYYDGTLIYARYISELAGDFHRNCLITDYLIENMNHYNLILSDRLVQLANIIKLLPHDLQNECVLINGTTKKNLREAGLEKMRKGKKHFLFASYKLAKEGLDIPLLDRLYLATPQKDEAIIIQSVGRIARTHPDKKEPICYDFVDDFKMSEKFYKQRVRSYKKCNCIF